MVSASVVVRPKFVYALISMSIFLGFVDFLINVTYILIFVRVIASWMRVGFGNPLMRMIYEVTEPMLASVRRLIPSVSGIDFSPLILLVLLGLAQELLSRIL